MKPFSCRSFICFGSRENHWLILWSFTLWKLQARSYCEFSQISLWQASLRHRQTGAPRPTQSTLTLQAMKSIELFTLSNVFMWLLFCCCHHLSPIYIWQWHGDLSSLHKFATSCYVENQSAIFVNQVSFCAIPQHGQITSAIKSAVYSFSVLLSLLNVSQLLRRWTLTYFHS